MTNRYNRRPICTFLASCTARKALTNFIFFHHGAHPPEPLSLSREGPKLAGKKTEKNGPIVTSSTVRYHWYIVYIAYSVVQSPSSNQPRFLSLAWYRSVLSFAFSSRWRGISRHRQRGIRRCACSTGASRSSRTSRIPTATSSTLTEGQEEYR